MKMETQTQTQDIEVGGLTFTDARILDSNGTKYVVGWDEYGWYSMTRVDLFGADDVDTEPNAVYNGNEVVVSKADGEIISFTPGGADELVDNIQGEDR